MIGQILLLALALAAIASIAITLFIVPLPRAHSGRISAVEQLQLTIPHRPYLSALHLLPDDGSIKGYLFMDTPPPRDNQTMLHARYTDSISPSTPALFKVNVPVSGNNSVYLMWTYPSTDAQEVEEKDERLQVIVVDSHAALSELKACAYNVECMQAYEPYEYTADRPLDGRELYAEWEAGQYWILIALANTENTTTATTELKDGHVDIYWKVTELDLSNPLAECTPDCELAGAVDQSAEQFQLILQVEEGKGPANSTMDYVVEFQLDTAKYATIYGIAAGVSVGVAVVVGLVMHFWSRWLRRRGGYARLA